MKNFARYTGMGLIALLGAIACSDKSANEYKLVRRITTIENLALAKGYDVQIWYTEDGKFVEKIIFEKLRDNGKFEIPMVVGYDENKDGRIDTPTEYVGESHQHLVEFANAEKLTEIVEYVSKNY